MSQRAHIYIPFSDGGLFGLVVCGFCDVMTSGAEVATQSLTFADVSQQMFLS